MNELVLTSMDIAQGESDLTKRIAVKGKDELGELSNWFNMFLERLNKLVLEIKENASSISNSTYNIVQGAEDLVFKGAEDLLTNDKIHYIRRLLLNF